MPTRRHYTLLAVEVLLVLGITVDALAHGSLVRLDWWLHKLALERTHPEWYPLAKLIEPWGQRATTGTVLGVVALLLARRRGTRRPLWLVLGAMLALNVVVGAMKFGLARAKPKQDTLAFFTPGGEIFPSGHTANVVLMWGLLVYLLWRYGPLRRTRRWGGVVAVFAVVMGMVSLYLDTHWATDIVAGWAAGAAILQATIIFDLRRPARRRGAGPRPPVEPVEIDLRGPAPTAAWPVATPRVPV